jgi:hypothetical protein
MVRQSIETTRESDSAADGQHRAFREQIGSSDRESARRH